MKTINKSVFVSVISVLGLTMASAAIAKKETLRQTVDRYFTALDSKVLGNLDSVDAPDLEMMTPMGSFRGIEGHKQLTGGFAMAFPNFKHTIGNCIESGDTIACEGKFSGDHTGPMMMPDGQTVPATRKHVEFPFSGIMRIKNGKAASIHAYFDTMSMMQQLGLLPPPPQTTAAK